MNKIVSMTTSSSIDDKYKNILVTVLMSSYNGENYIYEQINSIMMQIGVKVRLFIRDDGSIDNTLEIIKNLQEKYPQKISCDIGPNIGIHKSFDYLYRNAEVTDYFAFADEDDVWDLDKLYLAVKAIEMEKGSFYSSSSRLVSAKLNDLNCSTVNKKKYNHYMNTNSKILTPGAQGCTIVIKRDLIEILRKYEPKNLQGHDIWISTVAYYTSKSLYDVIPHMMYRQHDKSWTGNRKNKFWQKKREIIFFIKGSSRYHLLAEDILFGYKDYLTKDDQKILELLCQASFSFSARIKLIFSKGFGKYGLLQNIMFKIFLIFGIC